jgi:1-carboxybiuret hydrolase
MSAPIEAWSSATEISAAVRGGGVTAADVIEAALARIDKINPHVNAFTDVTVERARASAAAIDSSRVSGKPLGPLAGVPFAVKNLFDVRGLTTRAGSKINRENPAAARDAVLVERLTAAGAVLVGTLNMGEYAYDFTGENAHDGACRNPHDLGRMSGGSSSGSGAATASGLAPISLGTDTNGSLRVPASLCGVFSLKPTYGRLPRTGAYPFVDSLDHVGPLARTTNDLAIAYDALQGHDPGDHACANRAMEPTLPTLPDGIAGLRVGVAAGWFTETANDQANAAAKRVVDCLSVARSVTLIELEDAKPGRAAAYLITNAESAAFHLDRLRTRATDFDPDTRDRFLAGALLPAAWIEKAHRVRRWWIDKLLAVFDEIDVLIAPATPFAAPEIGQKTMELGGRTVALRPNIGLMAQPFSCAGFPIATVPVFSPATLPIGVQLIARPWREDVCLRAARFLEHEGIACAHPPTGAIASTT